MRTRNHTPETTRDSIRAFMVAALLAAITSSAMAVAQESGSEESLVPSWRQGVSRWGGEGYTLPTVVTPQATSTAPEISSLLTPPVTPPSVPQAAAFPQPPSMPQPPSAPQPPSTPYTMPVDPTLSPAPVDIGVAEPSPVANPYFQLPPKEQVPTSEELTALGLDPPGTTNAGSEPSAVLPPAAIQSSDRILPDVPDEPIKILPPAGSLEPSDRIELGAEALTVPSGVPPVADRPAETQGDQPDIETVKQDSAVEDAVASGSSDTESETIGEQIDINDVAESGPLEPEVIRWYHYPARWMRGWDSHAEFGLDGSDGNARTLAVQTGFEMKRQTDLYTLALDLDYRLATNRTITTEDNGRFNIDYDRLIHESPWSGFGKYGMEWDKFKAFDLRLNLNGGVGYYWVRQDNANLVTRFGAGASKEIGAPDDAWIPEAVMGFEADRQINSRQKIKGKLDYFPAWENFGNFRLVSDVAWEILLDDSDNLSLKLAATDRYDSTPQGAKKNDIYYSLLLLYKF